MTKDRTRDQARRDLGVMSYGEELLWRKPTRLWELATEAHAPWLLRRMQSRPGDPAGYGPVDVIGRRADYDNNGITRAYLAELLARLNVEGWLTRKWTVAHWWMSGSPDDQHADRVELTPAVFGYATDSMAGKIRKFADKYGYDLVDRPGCAVSEALRGGPAPNLYVAGEPRPSGLQIGTQRTEAGVEAEWFGINPRAMAEIKDAHQVTLWAPRGSGNQMYADLGGHFGALVTQVKP